MHIFNTVLIVAVTLCIYFMHTSNAIQDNATCYHSTNKNDFAQSGKNFTVAYLIVGDTEVAQTLSCAILNMTVTNNVATMNIYYKLEDSKNKQSEQHILAIATQQSNGKVTIEMDEIPIIYEIYFEYSNSIMIGIFCVPVLEQVIYIAYPANQPNLSTAADKVAANFTQNPSGAKIKQSNCNYATTQNVTADDNTIIEVL